MGSSYRCGLLTPTNHPWGCEGFSGTAVAVWNVDGAGTPSTFDFSGSREPRCVHWGSDAARRLCDRALMERGTGPWWDHLVDVLATIGDVTDRDPH